MAHQGGGKMRLEDFIVAGEISKGSFGVVYKLIRKTDDRVFALKQVKLAGMKRVDRQEAIDEARMLSQLNHPHVTMHYDSFIDSEDRLNIIMEFASGGSLAALIKSYKGKGMPEDMVWKFLIQSLLGLNHIHSKKIIHRDIKSLNLFLDANNNIKIGDLGIARALSDGSNFAHTIVGTPYYLSPELCEDKPYNEKSDIWALGVVMYECCMGVYPFDAQNEGALIRKILRGQYTPVSGQYSNPLIQMVKSLLTFKPAERPDTGLLLRHTTLQQKARSLGIDLNPRIQGSTEDQPVYYQGDNQGQQQASGGVLYPAAQQYGLPGQQQQQQQQYPQGGRPGQQQHPFGEPGQQQQQYGQPGRQQQQFGEPGRPGQQQQYGDPGQQQRPGVPGQQQQQQYPQGGRPGQQQQYGDPGQQQRPGVPGQQQQQQYPQGGRPASARAAGARPHSQAHPFDDPPQRPAQRQPVRVAQNSPYAQFDPNGQLPAQDPWDQVADEIQRMQVGTAEFNKLNADRVRQAQANVHAGQRDNITSLMAQNAAATPVLNRVQPEELPAAGVRPHTSHASPYALHYNQQAALTSAQLAASAVWGAQYSAPQYGRKRASDLMVTGPALRGGPGVGRPGSARAGGYVPAADDATTYMSSSYATYRYWKLRIAISYGHVVKYLSARNFVTASDPRASR